MYHYEHTQTGWLLYLPILALVIGGPLLAGAVTGIQLPLIVFSPAVLVMLLAAVFARLTVRVDGTAVSWFFGWGLPSGTIAFREIATAQVTQTSLFESFGIHWTIWHGWLWNVWGFRAVEITKRDGGRVTLGTDDPQGLFEAIDRFRTGAA
jgi:hypothetical protein